MTGRVVNATARGRAFSRRWIGRHFGICPLSNSISVSGRGPESTSTITFHSTERKRRLRFAGYHLGDKQQEAPKWQVSFLAPIFPGPANGLRARRAHLQPPQNSPPGLDLNSASKRRSAGPAGCAASAIQRLYCAARSVVFPRTSNYLVTTRLVTS